MLSPSHSVPYLSIGLEEMTWHLYRENLAVTASNITTVTEERGSAPICACHWRANDLLLLKPDYIPLLTQPATPQNDTKCSGYMLPFLAYRDHTSAYLCIPDLVGLNTAPKIDLDTEPIQGNPHNITWSRAPREERRRGGPPTRRCQCSFDIACIALGRARGHGFNGVKIP